jgi:hypothetical protein
MRMTASRRTSRLGALVAAVVGALTGTAAPACAAETSAVAVLRIDAPPAVRVFAANARFKFEGREAIGFDLDAATLGALALADVAARLQTQPPGATLPFDAPESPLRVEFDPDARRLRVLLAAGGELASVPFDPAPRPMRVCLRQRDQIALFLVPAKGGVSPLVWTGRLDYRLMLPDTDRYLLCREVRATMGPRTLQKAEVLQGIVLDNLDEAAAIRVEGLSPTGAAFAHEYPFDVKALEDRVDRAVGELVRVFQDGEPQPAGGDHAAR